MGLRKVPLFLVLLLAALAASNLPLAPTSCAETEYDNILATKNWALQFAITQDFTLSNFDGYMIAAKKQTSANRAWRFGAEVTGELGKDQRPEGVPTSTGGWRVTQFGIDLNLIRLTYPSSTSRAKFYYGFGPSMSFDYGQWKARTDPYAYIRETETGIGVMGLAGVEFFVTHSISLSAEYCLLFKYTYHDYKNINPYPVKSTSEDSRLSLESRPVLFGLTAYL